jgi:ABC-2 type transport system permease protein
MREFYFNFCKELQYIFCDGKGQAGYFIFGIPLFFTLLFGFVYSPDVLKGMPTVIYDQDQSVASRSLVLAFSDSERFDIVGVVDSEEEMEDYLNREQAMVVVGIPADFAKHIKSGVGTEVLLSVNAKNLMYPNSAMNFAKEIITTYNIGVGKKLVEAIGQVPNQALYTTAPIATRIRILYNPTDSYTPFMLPGMAANGLQIGIILSISFAIIREYKNQELWSRYSAGSIVVGKLMAYWLCAFGAAIISFSCYMYLYEVPFRGSLENLLLIYAAFTFAVTSLGLFFSALAPNEIMPFHPIEFIYFMPAFLYSGYSWPNIAKNSFAYLYAHLLPLNYAADTIRDILLIGYAGELLQNVFVLACGGVVVCSITIGICKHRVKKIGLAKQAEVSA